MATTVIQIANHKVRDQRVNGGAVLLHGNSDQEPAPAVTDVNDCTTKQVGQPLPLPSPIETQIKNSDYHQCPLTGTGVNKIAGLISFCFLILRGVIKQHGRLWCLLLWPLCHSAYLFGHVIC